MSSKKESEIQRCAQHSLHRGKTVPPTELENQVQRNARLTSTQEIESTPEVDMTIATPSEQLSPSKEAVEKRKLPLDEEDDSQRITKKSRQHPGGSPNSSKTRCGNNQKQVDVTILDVSSPTIPFAQAPQCTGLLTLVDTSADASTRDKPSLVDTAEIPATSNIRPQNSRKENEPIVSIASKLGLRRKKNTNQRPPITGESSVTKPGAESGASTKKTPLLRRTESVLCLDGRDDEACDDVISKTTTPTVRNSCATSSKFLSPADLLWPPPSKPDLGPLSELNLYVIPENVDSCVFEDIRKRTISLGGSWIGPKSKTLTTDPRVKHDVPILDQENTTHIVSALKTIEEVMRYLNVEFIDSKISIVSGEWLSDTIKYKTPMEVQGYALQQSESTTKLAKLNPSPSLSQGRTKDKPVQQSPDDCCSPESENSETDNQTIFNKISQGIQERSLHPDFLDVRADDFVNDIGESGNVELHTPELSPDPDRLSGEMPPEPTLGLHYHDDPLNHIPRTEIEDIGATVDRIPETPIQKPRPQDHNV
ncbi:hypothetical protein BGX26_010836 [Mortierella sp. AD094]|nr:hypothetical protein BGX26_010836 [Mortierella sp. AD094]